MECKNKFLNSLEDKKEFAILFYDKDTFDDKKINKFNEKLAKFIKLQIENDEIDLSFVCFHEYYNFLDEDTSFCKILKDLEILEFFNDTFKCDKKEEDKIYSKISKSFNFGNAKFYKRVEFIRAVFEKPMNFEGALFKSDINFEGSVFKLEVIFDGIRCEKEAIFICSIFEKKASFFRARFYDYSNFKDAKFYDEVDFENAVSKDIFFFHNVKLGKISLIGSHLENANFLRLKDKDKKVLQKDNFQNKDSVRLVKAQFEKENNTTEVNWSFPLEQEFYLDLLNKDSSYYPSKNINKISLLIHKYVSNYGTDWVRVLIVLFAFGFIANWIYSLLPFCPEIFNNEICKNYFIYFDANEKWILWFGIFYSFILYLLYIENNKSNNSKGWYWFYIWLFFYIVVFIFFKDLQNINNKIIALINPLNIFNQDMVYIKDDNVYKNINYFENIAWYGILIKVITVSLMYQFVISFRNSTRRK